MPPPRSKAQGSLFSSEPPSGPSVLKAKPKAKPRDAYTLSLNLEHKQEQATAEHNPPEPYYEPIDTAPPGHLPASWWPICTPFYAANIDWSHLAKGPIPVPQSLVESCKLLCRSHGQRNCVVCHR